MAGLDVAELGLAVDSGPVEKGAQSLDRLSASARNAAQAALNHAKAEQAKSAAALAAARASETASRADIKAAQAALSNAKAATAQARALFESEKAAYASAKAVQTAAASSRVANDNVRSMGLGLGGIAAQWQDTFVQASLGMNSLMIGMQQGTQMAGQFAMGMRSGQSFTSLLAESVTSLLSPLSLLTIAGVTVVAQLAQMVNWGKLAASILNTIADILPNVAQEAAIAGSVLIIAFGPAIVRSVIMLSRALLVNLVGALRAVAAAALANPFAAIITGIALAVTALYVFRDEVKAAVGVDVIGIIKDGTNLIIGSFVGAFEAIEAVWSKLPGVLGDIVYSTANAVIAGIETMVNKAIQAMRSLFSVLTGLPGPLQNALFGSRLILENIGEVNLGRIENPYAGAVGNAATDAYGAFQNAQGFDYVGKIGSAIGNAASAGAAKLKELAAAATSAGDAADKAGKKGKKSIDKYAEAVENAKQSLGQGLGGVLQGLLNKTLTWKEALLQVLRSALSYFDQMAKIGGQGGLFGGGIFGGLVKGLIGFSRGGVFSGGNVVPFASGGVVSGPTLFPMAGGRTGLMGEAGDEAIMPLKRGRDGRLGVAAANSNQPMIVNFETNIDATGADRAALERVVARQDEMEKGLSKKISQTVGQQRTRNVV